MDICLTIAAAVVAAGFAIWFVDSVDYSGFCSCTGADGMANDPKLCNVHGKKEK